MGSSRQTKQQNHYFKKQKENNVGEKINLLIAKVCFFYAYSC
jgi:hypothetical protein